jgi:hypothetical protein
VSAAPQIDQFSQRLPGVDGFLTTLRDRLARAKASIASMGTSNSQRRTPRRPEAASSRPNAVFGALGTVALVLIGVGVRPLLSSVPTCWFATGQERKDICYAESIHHAPTLSADQVRALARNIDDDLIRAAAVEAWVKDVRGNVPLSSTLSVCGLLDAEEEKLCVNRASAVHLH